MNNCLHVSDFARFTIDAKVRIAWEKHSEAEILNAKDWLSWATRCGVSSSQVSHCPHNISTSSNNRGTQVQVNGSSLWGSVIVQQIATWKLWTQLVTTTAHTNKEISKKNIQVIRLAERHSYCETLWHVVLCYVCGLGTKVPEVVLGASPEVPPKRVYFVALRAGLWCRIL